MSRPAPVLLTGATGQVGIHVLSLLLKGGFDVLAPSRSVVSLKKMAHASGANLSWINPTALNLDEGSIGALPDSSTAGVDHSEIETLVSAGPIGLALNCLESFPNLKRVVCLSTSSIITKAESPDVAERQQIQQIAADEQALETTCSTRNTCLVVLRPTMIYGCGMDENISRVARFIQRFGFLPLAGTAKGLRQPIHAADLAGLMAQLVQARFEQPISSAVVGGSTLTYRDMVEKVFHALGRKPRIISLSSRLLASSLTIARIVPGLKGLNPAMVLRQNQDLVFDDSEIRKRFDFKPRSFEPVLADFQLPSDLRDLLSG